VAGDIINIPLTGSTVLLTHTNDQAATLTALLCKMSVKAKLIQGNDDFNLYNLKELRWFCNSFGEGSDNNSWPVIIRLTHADVYLSYFKSLQITTGQSISGDRFKIDETGCYNKNDLCVVRFSESFRKKLASFAERLYRPDW
jgi:hypothetical protein